MRQLCHSLAVISPSSKSVGRSGPPLRSFYPGLRCLLRVKSRGEGRQNEKTDIRSVGNDVLLTSGAHYLHSGRRARTSACLERILYCIDGKLDVLRVECARCQRKGRYHVRKLIEKYGRNANMMKWKEQLNGDCPKRDAPQCTIAATWSAPIYRT